MTTPQEAEGFIPSIESQAHEPLGIPCGPGGGTSDSTPAHGGSGTPTPEPIDDGGTIFPHHANYPDQRGVSLRDWLAAMKIISIRERQFIEQVRPQQSPIEVEALLRYQFADAMIKARKQ